MNPTRVVAEKVSCIDKKSLANITNIRRSPKAVGNLNHEHKKSRFALPQINNRNASSVSHLPRWEGRLLDRPSFSFRWSGNRIWCGFLFFSPTLRVHTNVNKGKWRWAIVLTVSSPFIVGQPFDLMSEDGIR